MKKLILIIILGIIAHTATIAQGTASIDDENTSETGFKENTHENGLARLKASEDFLKSNKRVENVRWYDVPNGFFAYYTKDEKKGRSFYNSKGNFVYNSLSYQERSLPLEIRDRVKSVYYMDYKITHVNEILQDGKTIFIVQLTDNKSWKNILIHDDEMEVIKEFCEK
jgi:hypothetical protein